MHLAQSAAFHHDGARGPPAARVAGVVPHGSRAAGLRSSANPGLSVRGWQAVRALFMQDVLFSTLSL